VLPDALERFHLRRDRLMANLAAIERIRARSARPDPDDLPGLAWLLQSCYSEIEDVLKDIVTQFGEPVPSSTTWHRDLLNLASAGTSQRAAVISGSLLAELDQYRAFRHFSRNATFPILDWDRLEPLLNDFPATAAAFVDEVDRFILSHRT
jgi:hypothetical protein